MRVLLNGVERDVSDGATVAELVALTGAPARGVAVAIDGAVVPGARWGSTVPEGSTVDVLTAVQGG